MNLLLYNNNGMGDLPANVTMDDIYGHSPSTPSTKPKKSAWDIIGTVLDFGDKAAGIYTTVKKPSDSALPPPPQPSPGMSTTAKVAIGGGLLITSIVVYKVFFSKKKKS